MGYGNAEKGLPTTAAIFDGVMSGQTPPSQAGVARRRLLGLGAVFVAVSLVLAWWLSDMVHRAAMEEVEARGRQRLGLYLSSFRNHLEKYEYLPALLAQDGDVQALLRGDEGGLAADVNRRLERLNAAAHTSVLYVMDLDGTTLAASNWTEPTSFVGQNYSFRPYFRDALERGRGRYFAIGVTTGQPAFFFAEAIYGPEGATGAVVVRLDIEPLQQEWEEAGETVMLADEFGVAFLTSRADWRFTLLQPLDETAKRVLAETKKYSGLELRPLSLAQSGAWRDKPLLLVDGQRHLQQEQPLRSYGWRMIYLADIAPAEASGRVAAAAALAVCALLALTFLFVRQYRQRQQAREAVAAALRQARDELEARVAARTKDLQQQVRERERAERVLREAQDELVQAGKLAALGQMSAAIAHEMNQPLTAINTFAAASKVHIERGDLVSVSANLGMIEDLTRRMAAISRHLKTFARKSAADRSKPVSLQQVVRRSLMLLESRFRLEDIDVFVDVPEAATVAADDIRLEQVIINLLRNACDAMADRDIRRLRIEAAAQDPGWALCIADTGIGISSEHMPHLFDPFFTTKQIGDGLGLGLAISHGIVRDFGGSLTAENAADGGAVFRLWLPSAAAVDPADARSA